MLLFVSCFYTYLYTKLLAIDLVFARIRELDDESNEKNAPEVPLVDLKKSKSPRNPSVHQSGRTKPLPWYYKCMAKFYRQLPRKVSTSKQLSEFVYMRTQVKIRLKHFEG